MTFNDIEINVNSPVPTKSGYSIPTGCYIVIKATDQYYKPLNSGKVYYYAQMKAYYDQNAYINDLVPIQMDGLDYMEADLDAESGWSRSTAILTFEITGMTEINTENKRNTLIVNELASLMGKPIGVFQIQ